MEVYTHVCACTGQGRASGVLLSLPFLLKQGLTVPGNRLSCHKPGDPPFSVSHSAGVTGAHGCAWLFI